jgi:peptidoglycan/LPS O-acetylase OafA/YrhL
MTGPVSAAIGKESSSRTAFQASSRHNNFDFLRFLLAVIVIHTHSYALCGAEYTGFLQRLRHLDFGGAWLAVNGFFAISGFLIAGSWMKSPSLGEYLRRRALRIYPGFIACTVLCVVLVGPLGGADLGSYFGDWRTYAFFQPLILGPTASLPGVFTSVPWHGVVNASLWTIRFELFCYLLLATLGLSGALRRPRVILALFAVALACQFAEQHEWPTRWNMVFPLAGDLWELPRLIVFFLAGATLFVYRNRIPLDGRLATACVLALSVAFYVRATTLLLPVCGVYLLFYFAFSPRVGLQHFGKHGDFSYGMYLYAFPIQQLLVHHFSGVRSPILLTLLALPLTFGAAFMSWHLVEKPFLALKKKRHPSTGSAGDETPMAAAAVSAPTT